MGAPKVVGEVLTPRSTVSESASMDLRSSKKLPETVKDLTGSQSLPSRILTPELSSEKSPVMALAPAWIPLRKLPHSCVLFLKTLIF